MRRKKLGTLLVVSCCCGFLPAAAAEKKIAELTVALQREGNGAADAAWRLGWKEDTGAVPALAKALLSKDVRLSLAAAHAICRLDQRNGGVPEQPGLQAELGRLAASTTYVRVKWAANRLRGKAAPIPVGLSPTAAPPPKDFRNNKGLEHKILKARAAAPGKLGGPAGVPGLVKALAPGEFGRGKTDTVYSAAWGLGHIGGDEAVKALAAAFCTAEPSIRFQAGKSLGEAGTPEAVEVLIGGLKDPDRQMRHAAILGLSRIGGTKALGALKSIVEREKDRLLVAAAVFGLKQIGTEDALAAAAKTKVGTPAEEVVVEYRPRNRKLSSIPDNTWVNTGIKVPKQAGRGECSFHYDSANRLFFRQGGCTSF
ncbi:MAG: HEAT repeat domain-containing protein, partial [Planctomycetota bacterium]